jgi:tol-pal system protein YbgF
MRVPHTIPAILLAAAGFSAAGCVSTSDIDALHTQISDVQRQVGEMQTQAPSKQDVGNLEGRIGKQMESLLKTEADMQVKLQNLSSHIDELQAKLEETNNRLAQLSQQIAATNQDLQNFRSVAPSSNEPADGAVANPAPNAPNAPPPPGPAGAARPGAKADPKALYDSAYNDYLKGNYDLAMRGFQEYIDEFPDTDLTDNATYWVGECYYRQRKFRQAVTQFEQVLARFPRSDKMASALLKKGYAYLELGERQQAVVLLRQVVRQHGTSDEANLARQRLRELGVDAKP